MPKSITVTSSPQIILVQLSRSKNFQPFLRDQQSQFPSTTSRVTLMEPKGVSQALLPEACSSRHHTALLTAPPRHTGNCSTSKSAWTLPRACVGPTRALCLWTGHWASPGLDFPVSKVQYQPQEMAVRIQWVYQKASIPGPSQS